MYRSAAVLVIGLVLLTACNNEAKTNTVSSEQDGLVTNPVDNTTVDTIPVNTSGGDLDEKGCITSAGYRWSVIKDTCIRIFEAGIKMLPKDPSLDQTTAAFIVFSKDRVRVEMFLPTQKKAFIIRRKVEGAGEPTEWASGPLTLIFKDGVYSLDDEGKLLYQSAAGN